MSGFEQWPVGHTLVYTKIAAVPDDLGQERGIKDRDSMFTYSNTGSMPRNCCVPECTKMVYQQDGVKIAFYKFPEDRELFRKWIVATCTWRDIGKEFRVTDSKRVCSLDT